MRTSFRFKSLQSKLDVIDKIINGYDFNKIGHLKLKSKCDFNSEYCSKEYDKLYDLWEFLECHQPSGCKLNVKIKKKKNNSNEHLHCVGHKLVIKHGKIYMTQKII